MSAERGSKEYEPWFEVDKRVVERPDMGIVIATANFGKVEPQSEKMQEINGFPRLYQTDYETSVERRRQMSVQVVADLIKTAMEKSRWKKKWPWQKQEIPEIYVGSSALWDDEYLPDILKAAGLKMTKEEMRKKVRGFGFACTSGWRALEQALKNSEGNTLVITIDDLAGRAENDEQSDKISKQVFSTGAAVLALVPGKSMKLIESTGIFAYPDTRQALAAKVMVPSNNVSKDLVGTIQFDPERNWEYMIIPVPRNDEGEIKEEVLIEMQALNTMMMFNRVIRALREMFPDQIERIKKEVEEWVSHLPGFTTLMRALKEAPGIEVEWPKDVYGNNSGTTIFMHLVRMLPKIKPGAKIGFLGFGAGASAGAMEIQFGGKEAI
jgi:3-oxoacyl-[acyl-carrier-protein] synthase III